LHRSPPGLAQVWEVPTGKELLTFDTRTIDADAHPNRSSRRQMLGGQQQHRFAS
jgi:hypothetical protein